MGKIKKHWLLSFNGLLSFLLVVLGFGACEENRKDMYGMPPARFSVKANVLDEKNKPIEGIKVDIKTNRKHNTLIESGFTNSNGIFETEIHSNEVNIVCTDIDGEKNGTFKKDSVQADISDEKDLKFEFTIHLKEENDAR